jgi:hypothetical protein
VTKAPRFCPKCKAEVLWIKHKPEGARITIRKCEKCGTRTKPIKGRRKAKTMPKGLYNYRKLVKECDELWRQVVYKEKGRKCLCGCGKRANQVHHGLEKGWAVPLRHDPRVGIPLNWACHRRIHDSHLAARELLLKLWGPREYSRLIAEARTAAKRDLTVVKEELKVRLG